MFCSVSFFYSAFGSIGTNCCRVSQNGCSREDAPAGMGNNEKVESAAVQKNGPSFDYASGYVVNNKKFAFVPANPVVYNVLIASLEACQR